MSDQGNTMSANPYAPLTDAERTNNDERDALRHAQWQIRKAAETIRNVGNGGELPDDYSTGGAHTLAVIIEDMAARVNDLENRIPYRTTENRTDA